MINRIIKTGALLMIAVLTHASYHAQEVIILEEKVQETPPIVINEKRVGIKGGVNFTSLYGKDASNTDPLRGLNLGVFAKLPLERRVFLQSEIYFTAKGAELSYDNIFAKGSVRYRFNYFEIPVLISVKVNKNFSVHAGPYAGVLLSGRVTNIGDEVTFNFEQNINRDNFNKIDAGLAFGISVDAGMFSVGSRYCYGLTAVGKERFYGINGTSYTFPNARNGALSLYLSIALNAIQK
jgi:hypothetical protein